MDTQQAQQAHEVRVTRTHNEIESVPDALHLRCSCGWTSSAEDEAMAEQLTREHVASGDPEPIPSTISPY